MENQIVTGRRLGKQGYSHNSLTLMLAKLVLPEIRVPAKYDFDKGKKPFPSRMWGNDAYGDCVIGGRANHMIRLERVEQRRTIPLSDDDAVTLYKALTGCQTAGDANDTGLVVLDAMKQWKNQGWTLSGKSGVRSSRCYTIAAYGELEPQDHEQLKMGIYALHGAHMGFWLPTAVQSQTANGRWDYNGESGPEWQPGSWGGHLVYSKRYDENGVYVITWGQEVLVTWNFVDKYCDESWAVVDNLDSWRTKQTINVPALMKELQQISHKVNT